MIPGSKKFIASALIGCLLAFILPSFILAPTTYSRIWWEWPFGTGETFWVSFRPNDLDRGNGYYSGFYGLGWTDTNFFVYRDDTSNGYRGGSFLVHVRSEGLEVIPINGIRSTTHTNSLNGICEVGFTNKESPLDGYRGPR